MYGPLEMWGPGHLPTLPPSKSGTATYILHVMTITIVIDVYIYIMYIYTLENTYILLKFKSFKGGVNNIYVG